MTKTQILRVIEYMKEAKTIHVQWIEYLNKNPGYDSKRVGDQIHHQKWVDQYDETIELLLSFLTSNQKA